MGSILPVWKQKNQDRESGVKHGISLHYIRFFKSQKVRRITQDYIRSRFLLLASGKAGLENNVKCERMVAKERVF